MVGNKLETLTSSALFSENQFLLKNQQNVHAIIFTYNRKFWHEKCSLWYDTQLLKSSQKQNSGSFLRVFMLGEIVPIFILF